MASRKPYVLNKEDGGLLDLCRSNDRGRKTILAGMVKDFHNYCIKYKKGFNPPDRQFDEEVSNIRRQMNNVLTFKEYLRDTASPPRPEINEMLIVYMEWLHINPVLYEDENDTSFYDAEASVVGNAGGSRPITPILEEKPFSTKAEPSQEIPGTNPGMKKRLKDFGSSVFPLNDKLQALFARKQMIGSERAPSEQGAASLRRTPSSASADLITDPEALRRITNSPSFCDIVAQYHGGREKGKLAKPNPLPIRGITHEELKAIINKPISRKSSLDGTKMRVTRVDGSPESRKSNGTRRDSSAESRKSDTSENLGKGGTQRSDPPMQTPPEARFSLTDLHQIISDVLDSRLDTSLPEFITTMIDSRIGATEPRATVNQSFDLRILSETVAQIVDDRLKISDDRLRASISPEAVSQMVDIKVEEKLRATPLLDGYREGGCSYRSKEHLKELVKFSGSIEEYSTFRQQLNLCLERERFRDDKDKALFVYRYLAGPARDSVTHFIRPLDDDSFKLMTARLDWTYGGEKDLDRLLIGKLQKLPRIASFTQDSLIHMIVTIESAIPALLRREPESVTDQDGERLNRLLNLLPRMEIDFFLQFCTMKNRYRNMKGLLSFLKDKFEGRRGTLPHGRETRLDKRSTGFPSAPSKAQRKNTPGRYSYYQESVRSEADHASEDEQEATRPPEPVFKIEDPKGGAKTKAGTLCEKCKKPHPLAKCPAFVALTLPERRNFVRSSKVCIKCLTSGHFIKDCWRKGACGQEGCPDKHHPLLHDEYIFQAKFMEELGDGEDCEAVTSRFEEDASSDKA